MSSDALGTGMLGALWMSGPPDPDRITFEDVRPIARADLKRPELVSDRALARLNAQRSQQVLVRVDGRKACIVSHEWAQRLRRVLQQMKRQQKKPKSNKKAV